MNQQRMHGAFFFPTLGVGMEEALIEDTEAVVAAFRAFNRWLHDDWGFAYQERIFATPYLTLVDLESAVDELEWALERDARLIVMRPARCACPASAARSPTRTSTRSGRA